ncbi:MAG TPA: mannose-1-phosphate guanylyltransferase [Candidatus Limnocylindrales bacterium]|nr:mannose-1-phosphate guanylyltransferase [Candidatus Limnocylindrales bacterium]
MSHRSNNSRTEKLPAYVVILAGGRGTRFWPRSRLRSPKQLLNIIGDSTMLQQTAERLSPLFAPNQLFVVTNEEQAAQVRSQLPRVPRAQIISEPIGRNTAAAIGLAAIHLQHVQRDARGAAHRDALMAVLPADQYIARAAKYRSLVSAALQVASSAGQMVVLGIPPTRADTGFGYIECTRNAKRRNAGKIATAAQIFLVRRFKEKPPLAVARRYVATGRYFWNAGMFFWRASTFLENLRRFLPKTFAALEELSVTIGTPRYSRTLAVIYPRLENISVDYAILEPATHLPGEPTVQMVPAEIGWSDIGSWEAVYELLARASHGEREMSGAGNSANVVAGPHYTLDANGNFLWSPRKFVATVGVDNLIVVETEDALLICPRERAQDVGKIVKWLEAQKRRDLL